MKIVNHQHVTTANQRDVGAVCLTVLTKDGEGLYAVYVGVVRDPWADENCTSNSLEEAKSWVAANGDKMSWRKASCFYDIPEDKYRA